MQLREKATGEIYNITSGKILTKEEVLKTGSSGSFICLGSGDSEIQVIIGYNKDGDIVENCKFEVVDDTQSQTNS